MKYEQVHNVTEEYQKVFCFVVTFFKKKNRTLGSGIAKMYQGTEMQSRSCPCWPCRFHSERIYAAFLVFYLKSRVTGWHLECGESWENPASCAPCAPVCVWPACCFTRESGIPPRCPTVQRYPLITHHPPGDSPLPQRWNVARGGLVTMSCGIRPYEMPSDLCNDWKTFGNFFSMVTMQWQARVYV